MRAASLAGSSALCAALAAACARGSAETSGYETLPGGGTPSTTTTTTTGGHGGEPAHGGGGAGARGGGGHGGDGGQGGQGNQGGHGGEGGSCNFSAPNTCLTGEVLSTIAGDDGNDVSMAQGVGSKWLKIFVEESVSSLIDYPPLSFTATLQSPGGATYGLYVYVGDDGGIDCNATPLVGGGSPPSVHSEWSDTPAVDDGTWLAVEVRYLSGSNCQSLWTLTIQGNT